MDPYFVLPILMGGSMFLTQALNPPVPDPVQARVMKFMPIMFTVMFLFFPAGLVLYWLVNNLLVAGTAMVHHTPDRRCGKPRKVLNAAAAPNGIR